MSSLHDLFAQYGTDKGIWGYTPAYEHHLADRRPSVRAVLEVGICGYRDIPNNVVGASLFAWREYFPNAEVYGIDNDRRFIFNDREHIHTAHADAYCAPDLARALTTWKDELRDGLDFICDDAVHDPLPQIDLCRMLWPFLKIGGVYAIEDVCPYKCPHNSLVAMCGILVQMFPEMKIKEYQTHKEERLLILTKGEG